MIGRETPIKLRDLYAQMLKTDNQVEACKAEFNINNYSANLWLSRGGGKFCRSDGWSLMLIQPPSD